MSKRPDHRELLSDMLKSIDSLPDVFLQIEYILDSEVGL